MNVEGIMSQDFVEVPFNTRVLKVAKLMSEKNASCAIVFEREQPIGIFTRKDLVNALARGLNPERTEVMQVSSSPLTTMPHDADIQIGLKLMGDTGLGHIVVEKEHKPIGILAEHPIAHSVCYSYAGVPQVLSRDFTTLLSKDFVEVPFNTRVSKVAKLMSEKNASCAIVFERKQPIGMFTPKDLVNALARGLNPERTEVMQVSSSPLTTMPHDADIQIGLKLMGDTGRGHIVVEKEHKPIGILTEHQIAHLSSGMPLASLRYFITLPGYLTTLPGDLTTLPGDLTTLPELRNDFPPLPDHESKISFYMPMKFCPNPNCGHPREKDVTCTNCGTFLFKSFSIDAKSELGENFKEGSIPDELGDMLESSGLLLPKNPTVKKVEDKKWVITDREKIYVYIYVVRG